MDNKGRLLVVKTAGYGSILRDNNDRNSTRAYPLDYVTFFGETISQEKKSVPAL